MPRATASILLQLAVKASLVGIVDTKQQSLLAAQCTVPAIQVVFTCAGRKKRRAARGRTDVEDQPYEDPNMQVRV